MSNNNFKLLEEAELRLDQLFIETGFSANHPCMLDWATVKFALKDARQNKGSAEQKPITSANATDALPQGETCPFFKHGEPCAYELSMLTCWDTPCRNTRDKLPLAE
jgi:hypothetical protein